MIRRFAIAESSMVPALRDGDWVLALRLRRPARGHIVAFEHPLRPGFHSVKRIVGLPGETIAIAGGDVSIDGVVFDDPWTTAYTTGAGTWTVPPDSVFVLGDARTISEDSRSFGPVATSRCWRLWWCYWPRVRRLR